MHEVGLSRVGAVQAQIQMYNQWPEVMTTGYAAGLVTSLSSPTVIQARTAGRNYTLQVPPAKVLVGYVPCAAARGACVPSHGHVYLYSRPRSACVSTKGRAYLYISAPVCIVPVVSLSPYKRVCRVPAVRVSL